MGLLGSAGRSGSSGSLQAANNLSDVASASTSRTNLGLGTAAVENLATVVIDDGAGNLTLGSGVVTGAMIATSAALAGNPTTTTQTAGNSTTRVATTSFVATAVANGVASVNSAFAADVASTANIAGTYVSVAAGIGDTYTTTATGALTVDGIAITTGMVFFFKDLTSSQYNGLYNVTLAGSIGVSTIFTRALNYDQSSDINNTGAVEIKTGTVNALRSYILTTKVTNVGTDPLTYSLFTRNIADLLLAANNLSDLASASTSRTNLGLGTLATQSGTFSGTSSGTNTGDQTTVSGNAGTATTLATPRAIYGNNFDGSAALAQIITSVYGGTGNGFTKFSGASASEKTFTLPNASATVLTDNAVVTGAQGGTGVANTGSTITLGGNLTTSGAFATTITTTATTNSTLPAGTKTLVSTDSAVIAFTGGNIDGATIGATTPCKASGYSPVNVQSGTTFAPALVDNGTCVTLSNASAITVTIPANGSVAFPVGASIDFISLNTGIVTIAITTDTLVSKGSKVTLTGQYSVGNIKKVTSTKWVLSGDLA